MFLNKPALSVSFSLEDTVELIESTIKAKHWSQFEVADVKLLYKPYFVFNYDTFSEESAGPETEEAATTGGKVVTGTESGKAALDAISNALDDYAASLFDSPGVKLTNKIDHKYPYEVQRPLVRHTPEIQKIIQVKMAAKLQLPKDNVIITGVEMVYVPFWVAYVAVAEGNYRLDINAVTGEILNEQEVPEREKTWLEVTSETFEDLKRPGAWLEYSKQVGTGLFSGILSLPVFDTLRENRKLQIIILLIIALVVAAWATGIIKFG